MPSYILMVPLFLLGLFTFKFVDPEKYPSLFAVLCVVCVAGIAALFMLRAAVDEWWFGRTGGRRLTKQEDEFLNRVMPYYRDLTPDLKLLFQRRLFNFRLQKSYEIPGHEVVPPDVQLLVCASAIQVTLGWEKYIYPKLGTLVFYQKMFISPKIPLHPHAVEYQQEHYDCVILSMDAFVKGITQSKDFYQVGYHAFAKALQESDGLKDTDIPLNGCSSIAELSSRLSLVRGFIEHYQHTLTGNTEIELFPMCVENFFQEPLKFREELPELYNFIKNYLRQDPCFPESPLIQTPSVVERAKPGIETDNNPFWPSVRK